MSEPHDSAKCKAWAGQSEAVIKMKEKPLKVSGEDIHTSLLIIIQPEGRFMAANGYLICIFPSGNWNDSGFIHLAGDPETLKQI